jgi:hypothetical protein
MNGSRKKILKSGEMDYISGWVMNTVQVMYRHLSG